MSHFKNILLLNLIKKYAVLSFVLVISFSSFVFAEEITDKHTIKLVQAALNSEGYECGDVDGIVGTNTRDAIEEFQASKDMNATGIITEDLVVALGITPEMLKGVVVEDYIRRYNESVAYLNGISSETGDPTILKISKEELTGGIFNLDSVTHFEMVTDERKIAIMGLSLARDTNQYDIPMVYELVSSSYAMDDTFLTVDEAIEFVGDFVEEKSAVTEKMSYGIWNHEGTIYFTVTEIL